jgi:hypothetical protein
MKLTVVIRDISPFVHLQEPCTYRTVHIPLTDEQVHSLRLTKDEQISTSFIEND